MVTRSLALAVDSASPREERACAAAEIVRTGRSYRWVGIYDVGDEEIVLIGETGSAPPAQPRFGVAQGLPGEAVRTRATVVGNVEIVVPILGAESGVVIGTIDVRSDRADAFSHDDIAFVEECAAVLRPLFD